MQVESTWFESLEEYEDEEFWAKTTLVKGKCVLDFCPKNYI
jgi:hypothetical protein